MEEGVTGWVWVTVRVKCPENYHGQALETDQETPTFLWRGFGGLPRGSGVLADLKVGEFRSRGEQAW